MRIPRRRRWGARGGIIRTEKDGSAQKVSNAILSGMAGVASFVFSLAVFLYIKGLPEQVAAAVIAGVFCVLISYVAAERPNSENARALKALGDRLLAVEDDVLDLAGGVSPRDQLVQVVAVGLVRGPP